MNSSNRFSLQLLGRPLLSGPDGSLTGPAGHRHRIALLALLDLAPGRATSRDKLMGLLWPESDTEAARKLLNQSVYKLRKALGETAIRSSGEELHLDGDVVQSDVVLFEAAVNAGDYRRAADLYRGPFMDGFFLAHAGEFDQWVETHRQRLAGEYARALETLGEKAAERGDLAASVEWWRRRAAHDPYDSSAAIRLAQSLELQGNRAGALLHARQHTQLLHDELGIAPPAELRALTDRLRQEPVTSTAAPSRDLQASSSPSVDDATPPYTSTTESDETPTRRISTRGLTLVLIATLLLGAALFAYVRRADSTWLLEEAIPGIESYLDVADWESAYQLARQVEKRAPGNSDLNELWPRIAWRVTIHSEPEGATVYRQAYDAPANRWEKMGTTPLVNIRFPHGLSRIRFELAGYQPLIRALGGGHLNWSELRPADPDLLLAGPELYKLETNHTLPHGMVRVPAWTFVSGKDTARMNDFFIGRHEVTNAEYKMFVDAGGYAQPRFWNPVVVHGDTIPWREVMKRFVDRTGRAGPSTWEAGDYPRRQDDYPVSGVSWYEAAAYARFAGHELPTAHHWQQALPNALFPWLLPLSNFSGEGPRAVTQSRAMTHVGAYDMSGNVREWTASSIGDQRVILGGSWSDPYYIAGLGDTSAPPEDRSATNGIRTAIIRDEPALAALVRAPLVRTTTTSSAARQPIDSAVYQAYSRVVDYDRVPLEPTVDVVDTSRLWIREHVQFASGYGAERTALNLYVPRRARPPFQVVMYWPGWDVFALDDADDYFVRQIDFLVKSGRAVAFPIYRGTFERRVANERRRPDFGSAAYRDNTIYTVKDLRRSIDYLETRSDVDRARIAFFGYSWGGVNGPLALAQEPRLRVAIIEVGLLPPLSATPEVDPVNSLPRVRVPTLMLSGEFDPMVPRENAERYFNLIGTKPSEKRHVIAIGGHFIPRDLLIRETLDWLDKYLGPVKQ